MNKDTIDFLTTLLRLADNPDDKERRFKTATIDDFSHPLGDLAEEFVDGFKRFLTANGFNMNELDGLERSFGGNV